ncbi:MAG TPA: Gfo/Idh/MocA family oxidoreductase [Bryobacteraceae bacterium]|nr:Gfo/Idh/MocA family oxidoreductase [Bryobacteraceae bacterium]
MKRTLLLPVAVAGMILPIAVADEIRVGILGTDSSHAVAFTEILNDPSLSTHIPGARVVAAVKGGSPDLAKSYERVDRFAEEIRTKWGVEIVPDTATLCARVDAVIVGSIDGRVHLEQVRQVLKARKPMYIDKPLAASLDDAREIARLARDAGVPWFSSSSLRFSPLAAESKFTDARGYIVWGPGPLEEHHRMELAWYGVHSADLLFALMGRGCEEVTRTFTDDADVTTCRWKDGRIGTMRINRPYSEFGVVAFRVKEVSRSAPNPGTGYPELMREVVRFFETGRSPVSPEETIEVFAFMDAAQRSKEAGGAPQKLR